MKLKVTALIFFIIIAARLTACGGLAQQVYGGGITYYLGGANPLICHAVVTMYFDVNETIATDSITIVWGDSTRSQVFASEVSLDTFASQTDRLPNVYKHVYIGKHVYSQLPPNGSYHVFVDGQYRINNVLNIAGGVTADRPFYIETEVHMDTTAGIITQVPPLNFQCIGFDGVNSVYNEAILNEGTMPDSFVFELVAPQEGEQTAVPLYKHPDQYCDDIGEGGPFTINNHTGLITWSQPCVTGIFTVAVAISDYRNGNLIGRFMYDENIYVINGTTTDDGKLEVATPRILPNPAHNQLQIALQAADYSRTEIFSTTGKLLQTVPLVQLQQVIDISGLPCSIYILRLTGAENTSVQSFVKQ